jgi:hypothetical protein
MSPSRGRFPYPNEVDNRLKKTLNHDMMLDQYHGPIEPKFN